VTVEQVAVDPDAFNKATRRGVIAAILLAILSIVEYIIAVEVAQPLWPLLPFVILKGWIILDAFMHVRAVFGSGGSH